ncbi:hypothetical protein [Phytohabitans kaempferiae]|uniref:RNA polymerase sigma-70 region 4 domain-containing protein n=1 Tax=Phytohabitans kaempferiae TaxID=1620943 RepID=A0ABV6MHV8_9ACTN
MDPPTGDPPDVEPALGALARALDQVVAAIKAQGDPQRAFEGATRLADAMREAAESAADLRAQTAVRIWEEEKISLAGLAERIGVSKARAGQLVQRRRAHDQGSKKTQQGEG